MKEYSEKYRSENKYFADEADFAILETRISGMLKADAHAENGIYSIRSLYFDTYSDRFLNESINGTDPREKYRIRIYNGNTDLIRLECKKKLNGKNHKDSVVLTKEQVENIIFGNRFSTECNSANKLLNRFYMLMNTEGLVPKTIVEYERTPFIYDIGNVRVTFDRCISGSNDIERFLTGDFIRRPLMETGRGILEVKFDELLPNEIENVMQLKSLNQVAFSKYVMSRKFCDI